MRDVLVPGAMSSASSTRSIWSSGITPLSTGRASGASSVRMTTNSWALGPSFWIPNEMVPGAKDPGSAVSEKSFIVTMTSPVASDPEPLHEAVRITSTTARAANRIRSLMRAP